MLDVTGMENDWRNRLIAAIKADGRSLRSISRTAKLGPNFVNQLVKSSRIPGVDQFLRLTTVLGVSPTKILIGVEMTPEDEELLLLAARLSDEGRAHLLSLFQEIQARERG
jgi:lambda repressor-like predicted transcriptional regulator